MHEIVPYTHDYLSGVYSLLCQLWPEKDINIDTCYKILDTGLRSENQIYICSLMDGDVFGFCSLTITNSLLVGGLLAYIDELVIDEKYRGHGIGLDLLLNIEKIAVLKGCKKIELISAFHRQEAHHFYEKNGYSKTAYLFEKILMTT